MVSYRNPIFIERKKEEQ
jgi:hypothetical protein